MVITINTTAAQVANYLRLKGFQVRNVAEPNDTEDGEIWISESVHVQVGFGYANMVTKIDNDRYLFGPTRVNMCDLEKDLRAP